MQNKLLNWDNVKMHMAVSWPNMLSPDEVAQEFNADPAQVEMLLVLMAQAEEIYAETVKRDRKNVVVYRMDHGPIDEVVVEGINHLADCFKLIAPIHKKKPEIIKSKAFLKKLGILSDEELNAKRTYTKSGTVKNTRTEGSIGQRVFKAMIAQEKDKKVSNCPSIMAWLEKNDSKDMPDAIQVTRALAKMKRSGYARKIGDESPPVYRATIPGRRFHKI